MQVRTAEGFFEVRDGLDSAIARGLAYAPYTDLIWCETAKPDLDEARRFAGATHAEFPTKMLDYNCSPSFNWSAQLDEDTIAMFQKELGIMGYRYQFITLAGFHSLNASGTSSTLALTGSTEEAQFYTVLDSQISGLRGSVGFLVESRSSIVG